MRFTDKHLRSQWLREGAPFKVVPFEELPSEGRAYSFTRWQEWKRQGTLYVVVSRDGYVWRRYPPKELEVATAQGEAPEEYVKALNDEAVLAIMVHGTQAEKLVK